MSILLSENGILDIVGWPTKPAYELHQAIAKAQAVHAVQYLEAPCTQHPYFPYRLQGDCADYHDHRFDCPDCMKQIHEELNIQ